MIGELLSNILWQLKYVYSEKKIILLIFIHPILVFAILYFINPDLSKVTVKIATYNLPTSIKLNNVDLINCLEKECVYQSIINRTAEIGILYDNNELVILKNPFGGLEKTILEVFIYKSISSNLTSEISEYVKEFSNFLNKIKTKISKTTEDLDMFHQELSNKIENFENDINEFSSKIDFSYYISKVDDFIKKIEDYKEKTEEYIEKTKRTKKDVDNYISEISEICNDISQYRNKTCSTYQRVEEIYENYYDYIYNSPYYYDFVTIKEDLYNTCVKLNNYYNKCLKYKRDLENMKSDLTEVENDLIN
jgi:DNA repair ATPase RecN